jgi:site-specific DNA-methyltransferase (adenine-specific)
MTRDDLRNVVLVGDVRTRLAEIPESSVDTVICSPPYVLTRDYQAAGQIGLEAHVDQWVEELRSVARGLTRVLKPGGSLWLNVGDSYSRHQRTGAPAKSLLLGPEKLVLALLEDGWIVRNKVIWAKPNPMPASVNDRLACSWEVIYLLVRSGTYHFDLDAIRVPHRSKRHATCVEHKRNGRSPAATTRPPVWAGPLAGSNTGLKALRDRGVPGHPLGANPRDVWSHATASVSGHHATYPPGLIERPLRATCPERTCRRCGVPWRRDPMRVVAGVATPGDLQPGCRCRAGWQPGLVLDPFFGAGSTAIAAERHDRDWVGIELNPAFAKLALARIEAERARRRQTTTSGRTAELRRKTGSSSNSNQRKEVTHA